jgi:PAS domain S-box-containing protein
MLTEDTTLEVRAVFDTVDVGIILLDRQTRIVIWNEWVARVTRAPAPAVLGRSLFDVFPDLRDTRLPIDIEDCFQAGSSSLLTHSLNSLLPLRGESDEELLHNIIVRPVISRESQHCLLQINDVTSSVTRERVLRERQNARYHAIVDTAPDAIITISLDRTIQWMNSAAVHVFGYAPSEVIGQKIDILLDQDDRAAVGLWEDREGAGHSGHACQVVARRKEGVHVPCEMSFARWISNERTFITTMWRDVTDRMAAEQALRESEGRHRALLEALPQLVWTCGADGRCDYSNPQWHDYAGSLAEEHLGWGWLEAVHDADRKEVEAAWKTSVARRVEFGVEARLRRSDGTYRWFKLRSIPVSSTAGAVARWFGTATDITDLVEARETLRRGNEELEAQVAARTHERELAIAHLYEAQRMESIGQLSGGVAHDFNNLLAVILGSLRLLKKSLPDDPHVLRLVESAMQGAERGATLTNRLLAFARRQELKPETVDVGKLILDLMDFLGQTLGPKVAIDIDIAPDVQPITIDTTQLELALMNVMVNARDAMPDGGRITITCRNEANDRQSLPQMLADGDYVRLSIADTGEGMNEDTLSRAIEPFFTTKGVGKGTGLGLSMVQGLAAQSGGAMDVISELGKGTIVTLWLPQARHEVVPVEPASQATPTLGTGRELRILLVDDDALVSMNTACMLMDLGHSVVEAHSASTALQLLESNAPFDVVLTDYAMPEINGLQLAMRIYESRPGLLVVIASGYAELPTDTPLKFPRLQKPYTQEELARALEREVHIEGSG